MRAEFERINAELIAARKAMRERDRLRDRLAEIDRWLHRARGDLSLAATRRARSKEKLAALVGMTPAGLFYAVLGRHEQEFEERAADYVEAKMAHRQCKTRLAELERQKQELDGLLVALADVELVYEQRQREQERFIIRAGSPGGAQLESVLAEIELRQGHQQELEGALGAGAVVQEQLTESLDVLYGRRALPSVPPTRPVGGGLDTGLERMLTLATRLQRSLDDLQTALVALSYQFWPPIRVAFPEFTGRTRVPAILSPLDVLSEGAIQALVVDPGVARKLRQWQRELEKMQARVMAKMDAIKELAVANEQTLATLDDERHRLVESAWQSQKERDYDGTQPG